jgi:hypothetical protein
MRTSEGLDTFGTPNFFLPKINLDQILGGTLRDSLTKDVFKHNFKRILKPQYIDKVFAALGMNTDGSVLIYCYVMLVLVLLLFLLSKRTTIAFLIRLDLQCSFFFFRAFPGLIENLLFIDIDHDGTVSFREFVMVTHILFDGTDDEKLDCKKKHKRNIIRERERFLKVRGRDLFHLSFLRFLSFLLIFPFS